MNKYKYILALLILAYTQIDAQIIEIDSIISQNKLSQYTNQKLILIDFWATWCAPCKPATRQLEIYQNLLPTDIYMISISDESNDKIIEFLAQDKINIMVCSDFKSQNVNKYHVLNRPHAVLIDINGNKLWEGKPGDLNIDKLNTYIKSASNIQTKKTLSEIIQVSKDKIFPSEEVYDSSQDISTFYVTEKLTDAKSSFKGELKEFISLYQHTPLALIEDNEWGKLKIQVNFTNKFKATHTQSQMIDSVMTQLNLDIKSKDKKEQVLLISYLNTNMLWDSTQLALESNSKKYNIDDMRIQADDISIPELASKLSNLKKEIYIYQGNNQTLYDWDFNYSIKNLMYEELKLSFGIDIRPIYTSVKYYSISKR